ncbi:MAG: hypothetical protein K5987_08720 [Lachnospiraceae bacterium]|nr:hypothetical protein [Lachnospiraceae bacterium]
MRFLASSEGNIVNGDCVDSIQITASGNYGGSMYRVIINTTGGREILFCEERSKEAAFMLSGAIMNTLLSGQEGIITYEEIKSRVQF